MIKKNFYLLLCLCFFFSGITAQKKRSDLERLKQATQQRIQETNRLLSKNKKTTLQSLTQLNLLGQEIHSRRTLIAALNDEMRLIEQEQQSVGKEIRALETSLQQKKQKYAQALRGMYNARLGVDEMLFVLTSQNFTQVVRRARYLKEYSDWRKAQAQEIMKEQEVLQGKKHELERKRAERHSVMLQRQKETQHLQKKEVDQQNLVNKLKSQQNTLQKELKQQQQQARNLDRQIQRLIEEEARLAAKKRKTKPSDNGEYMMDKAETALSGSFAKNKGRLPYPVTGSFSVVGHFGTQQHAQLKYVVTNNSGIDIMARPGAEARAVFDGIVSRVFIVPGYNSSVIIRHGNYLTVYSNLSHVYVKSGDAVKTRQSIGKIFTDTENDNQTRMQFQLWKETSKQNPEAWLRR